MLEWLVGVGAVEVGKAVFEQGLKLSQAAAEDYVKDFFKDCLKEGLALGKPEVTKKAVATAVKEFLAIVARLNHQSQTFENGVLLSFSELYNFSTQA